MTVFVVMAADDGVVFGGFKDRDDAINSIGLTWPGLTKTCVYDSASLGAMYKISRPPKIGDSTGELVITVKIIPVAIMMEAKKL
jgi:hypothetical protein